MNDRLFLVWRGRQSAIRVWDKSPRQAAMQFARRKDVGDGSVIRVVSADMVDTFKATIGISVEPFREEYVN